jgi:H+/Cl- antiporter ClcA
MPLVGAVVAGVYHHFGGRAKGGTPAVLEQAHTYTHGVPLRMTPLILGGSIAGHLTGGAVGREGVALQMAGSLTDTAARVGRLGHHDRRLLVAASMAAGWGAVFAAPFTGVMFALQVCKHQRRRVVVPAIIAGFVGKATVDTFGWPDTSKPHLKASMWTIGLPAKLALLGIALGLLARLFVKVLKRLRRLFAHLLHYPPLRAAVGGFVLLGLAALAGRQYMGTSSPLLANAIDPHGTSVTLAVPLLKLLYTAISLASGFVGGEVLPLFIGGATLGAAISPTLGVDRQLFASMGSTMTFASAASVMLTGIVLTVEQYGWHALAPVIIVALFARLAAGRPGLYATH